MAVSVTELQGLRDELVRARATGEARVRWEGRMVEYRSVAEIDQAIARTDQEIKALQGKSRPRRVHRHVTDTGWSK